MTTQFTPHILPLVVVAVLSAALLYPAWKNRRDPVARWFAATAVALIIWSVGYTVELSSQEIEAKIFWANLQFVGVPAISVCWWELVRRHVGLRRPPRAVTAVIWAIPALSVPLAFANPAGLFRTAAYVVEGAAPFSLLHNDYGPWYWWVLVPTMSILNVAALALLGRSLLRSHPFYRRQYLLLFLALLLPLVGNFLYVLRLLPWKDYNPAVAILGASCVLVAVGLFRYGLFAVVPLARDTVVEDLADPVIVVDRLGRVVDVNRSAQRLVDLGGSSAISRPATEVLAAYPVLLDVLGPRGSCVFDGRTRRDMVVERDGRILHFAVTCSPVTTNRKEWLGSAIVMHDVTERVQLLEQTREMANRDDLTGLANRRHFFTLTAQELERARRNSLPLSFLVMDVDHFKNVNDTFGHRVGDELLRELARVCESSLRPTDVLGRVGGEEFAILLPETRLDDAVAVAARVRAAVAAVQMDCEPMEPGISVTVSMGLTELDHRGTPDGDAFQALYERADRALYTAKRSGRNMVVASSETRELLVV